MSSGIDPMLTIFAAGLLGLVIGSFLNLLIHRLPRMLERRWKAQCEDLNASSVLAAPPDLTTPIDTGPRYDLVMPRSHCPSCNTPLRVRDLVPVFSWLALRGRCAACGVTISPRYPLVELLTATLFALAAARFGLGWPLACALVITAFLVALTFIDLDTYYLPDELTLLLMWGGLAASVFAPSEPFPVSPRDAVLGAVFGYLALWIVYQAFKLATGREGMGYGDFKLLAALGAWLGPMSLLPIVLMASFVGAAVGLVLMFGFGRGRYTPLAFGPYLAAAGWVVMVYGDPVTPLLRVTLG